MIVVAFVTAMRYIQLLNKMAIQFKLCLYVSLSLHVYLCSIIHAQNLKREKQGVSFAKFIKQPSAKLDVVEHATLSVSSLV